MRYNIPYRIKIPQTTDKCQLFLTPHHNLFSLIKFGAPFASNTWAVVPKKAIYIIFWITFIFTISDTLKTGGLKKFGLIFLILLLIKRLLLLLKILHFQHFYFFIAKCVRINLSNIDNIERARRTKRLPVILTREEVL